MIHADPALHDRPMADAYLRCLSWFRIARIRTVLWFCRPVRQQREFEPRFKNWVRWCWEWNIHYGKVGSAEGNYRSPQIWEMPGPRPVPTDHLDAYLLNQAFVELDEQTRRTIKILVFRPHLRPQWQAQKIGCHYTMLEERLKAAKLLMAQQVGFMETRLTSDYHIPTIRPITA